jgi:hypothetical protein
MFSEWLIPLLAVDFTWIAAHHRSLLPCAPPIGAAILSPPLPSP